MHVLRLRGRLRPVLAAVAVGSLLILAASPVAADQSNHTERMKIGLTAAGAAAEHPELRAGQVVNIHTQGPVVFAIEDYLLNGARPSTAYDVVLDLYAVSCAGPLAFPFANGVTLKTDASGNAHGQVKITPDEVAAFDLHDTDWGIVWSFVDDDGVIAYETGCSQVHID